MPNYKLTKAARRNLAHIEAYTVEKWGIAQAKTYLADIENTLNMVAMMPNMGRARNEIRVGYRSIQTGSHVAFYRLHGGIVEVVHILHERMDEKTHL